jgi:hypothetical protein
MPDSTSSSKSPEMLFAEQQLREARGTSAEIAGKVERLLLIRDKMQAHLGAVDLKWELRRFFEANVDAYYAWASGESGKLPSSKQFDSLENDARLIGLAVKHVEFRLQVLDTAAKMSLSDELAAKARILTLRSRDENFRTGRVLDTMRGELGHPDSVLIVGGPAQKLEEEADRLTAQAAALRRDAEQRTKLLQESEKEQKEATRG